MSAFVRLLAAHVVAARVELLIRRTSPLRVASRLGVQLGRSGVVRPLSAVERQRVGRAIDVVERVYRHWPGPRTCLRRSFVLAWLLRDLGADVVLGVRRAGDVIEGHAWVEVAGEAVTPEVGEFEVLKR